MTPLPAPCSAPVVALAWSLRWVCLGRANDALRAHRRESTRAQQRTAVGGDERGAAVRSWLESFGTNEGNESSCDPVRTSFPSSPSDSETVTVKMKMYGHERASTFTSRATQANPLHIPTHHDEHLDHDMATVEICSVGAFELTRPMRNGKVVAGFPTPPFTEVAKQQSVKQQKCAKKRSEMSSRGARRQRVSVDTFPCTSLFPQEYLQ